MLTPEPGTVPESLLQALSDAENRVSRLDEQVRASPLGPGWAARLDFAESAAWSWARNELAPVEDLVLHDAHMDVRAPTQDLARATGLLRARRKAWQGGAELLSLEGALWLAGRSHSPPPPRRSRPEADRAEDGEDPDDPGLMARLDRVLTRVTRGMTESSGAGLAEWFALLRSLEGRGPDLLVAAAALDGWRLMAPLPREDYLGPILVGIWLRSRRRLGSHLLAWQGAASRRPASTRLLTGPVGERLAHTLESFAIAADLGSEELRRLTLARKVVGQRIADRRRNSRAGALLDLLLASPLVSAPMAASRLKITQQAVRTLIEELGPSVREISGRKRFQAWQI